MRCGFTEAINGFRTLPASLEGGGPAMGVCGCVRMLAIASAVLCLLLLSTIIFNIELWSQAGCSKHARAADVETLDAILRQVTLPNLALE